MVLTTTIHFWSHDVNFVVALSLATSLWCPLEMHQQLPWPKQGHCNIFYLAAALQIVARRGKQRTRTCTDCGLGWWLSGVDMLSGEGLSRKNRVISTNFQGFEIEVFKDFGERASNLDKR